MSNKLSQKQALHIPGVSEPSDETLEETPQEKYLLCLYVSGMAPKSLRAIENVHKLCAEHLAGRHDLKIIDIYQQPALAKKGTVIVVPTLVKERPLPAGRFSGDFSQTEQILTELGIRM